MKLCTTSCALAIIFSAGSVATFLNAKKKPTLENLRKSLDKDQLKKYNAIVLRRTHIYSKGLIVGIVTAISILILKILLDGHHTNVFTLNTLCILLSTTLITSYLFYMLSPKGDYLVSYLKRKDQRDEWVEVYKTMQYNYYLGLALATVAMLFASKTIC
jgi:hypothetical protein